VGGGWADTQEGRGIGLANKIAAYHLQESGMDTVDANRALNLPDDSREYSAVANMLRDMDVKSIKYAAPLPLALQPRVLDAVEGQRWRFGRSWRRG